ncbi:MAG: sigma-70 family RNA polymerase sigma factor [Planctomycetota bacterium]|nr:sigma-70 family RNA polymerase sigma factor [Planctomycetota bacterium]
MHSEYRSSVIRELRDQQVRFAPRAKKLEQVERAERLLGELDSSKTYSYEYLCFRITDYRPESSPKMLVTGEAARHDVRLFVEDVSEAADVRVEDMPEPVHSVDSLSKLLHVSTKTINRWREQGLVSRRFIFDGGQKRVGFLQSSVDRFVSRNQKRVQRGERFSQLSEQERGEIVDRARRLARAGAGQSEVARRIAKHTNRSVEAIRYTLKQFDRKFPVLAIFPGNTGPLTEELKRKIYQDKRRGLSVPELSRRYRRTRTTIYRLVNEIRAKRLLELPLDCIYNAVFDAPDEAQEILGPLPESTEPVKKARGPTGLPPYLAALYEVPLLTREQEYHLFRKFNYLRFEADRLRSGLHPARASTSLMNRIESLYGEAVRTKNQIVQANLRLVVSIAKRHVNTGDDLFSLISDGNVSLIRAAEKFDFSRGNKFSTYASWAIMRNFARTIPDEYKYQDRYRTSNEEMFAGTRDSRSDQREQESAQFLREQQIEKILSRLDEREQRIIISRFGLDWAQEPKTLKEVGSQLGVTKERIRQIEARALDKLRLAAEEEKIDLPE